MTDIAELVKALSEPVPWEQADEDYSWVKIPSDCAQSIDEQRSLAARALSDAKQRAACRHQNTAPPRSETGGELVERLSAMWGLCYQGKIMKGSYHYNALFIYFSDDEASFMLAVRNAWPEIARALREAQDHVSAVDEENHHLRKRAEQAEAALARVEDETIERCAKVCDIRQDEGHDDGVGPAMCATRIRALPRRTK